MKNKLQEGIVKLQMLHNPYITKETNSLVPVIFKLPIIVSVFLLRGWQRLYEVLMLSFSHLDFIRVVIWVVI